jgi:glucosamine-6-phosphate deaminase
VDGHIGFNEPTSSLGSRTRRKSLMEPSRRVHEAAFGSLEAVPRQCVTMGIGTILESRQCLLLAFGEAKAEAVAAAVEGPVSCMVPASALQFHPDARFILDTGASSLLKLREYYNVAYGNGR